MEQSERSIGDELMTTEEVAGILRLRPSTIGNWRKQGMGPPYIKVTSGRTSDVRYRRSELLTWLESRRVDPTAGVSDEVTP